MGRVGGIQANVVIREDRQGAAGAGRDADPQHRAVAWNAGALHRKRRGRRSDEGGVDDHAVIEKFVLPARPGFDGEAMTGRFERLRQPDAKAAEQALRRLAAPGAAP